MYSPYLSLFLSSSLFSLHYGNSGFGFLKEVGEVFADMGFCHDGTADPRRIEFD